MKSLLLFILVTAPAAFAAGPNCNQLQNIAAYYERLMQTKTLPEGACAQETLPNLQVIDSPLLKKSDVLEKFRCAPLSAMEERVRTLENKITLIGGFEILKDKIDKNKEQTAQSNLTKAQRAGTAFQKALVTAKSFELLLNTEGGTKLLRQIKEIPEARRDTPEKLLQELRTLCANRAGRERNAKDACSADFNPDLESVKEINTVISQSNLSDEDLASWTNALAIKKLDGSDWSFRQMSTDLERVLPKYTSGSLELDRNQLNHIKNLPDFQSVAALPFTSVLSSGKSGMEIHTALEKFKFVAEDLKARLQVESRSKISFLWSEAKRTEIELSPEQRAACEQSSRDFENASACWTALKLKKDTIPSRQNKAKKYITDMTAGLDSSFEYLGEFNKVTQCLTPNTTGGASDITSTLVLANTGDELTNCSYLNMLNDKLVDLQNEVLIINGLRDKIARENERDMKFRNFAIEKLATMNCAASETSVVDCEEKPLENVAPAAMSLVSDIIGMSIVHSTPKEETSIESECEESTTKEREICSFYDSPPVTPNAPARLADTAESPYIEAPNARDPSREAFLDGISGIGWGIVSQLTAPRPVPNYYQPMNPFPYNYTPYPTAGMLSPAQQVLFNSRFYGGYGFYSPTLGVPPLTAYPVSSPYVGGVPASPLFANYPTFK